MQRDRLPLAVEGFILAGGGSERFGSDKALATYRGRPLLRWAVKALTGIGLRPTLITPQPAAYRSLGLRMLTNERKGRGPQEGVRVALDACRTPWAFILAVDMPRVGPDLLRAILSRASADDRVICLVDGRGRRHPFPGLYRRQLLDDLAKGEPKRSMRDLLDRAVPRLLQAGDLPEIPDLDEHLLNVNRPENLDEA